MYPAPFQRAQLLVYEDGHYKQENQAEHCGGGLGCQIAPPSCRVRLGFYNQTIAFPPVLRSQDHKPGSLWAEAKPRRGRAGAESQCVPFLKPRDGASELLLLGGSYIAASYLILKYFQTNLLFKLRYTSSWIFSWFSRSKCFLKLDSKWNFH